MEICSDEDEESEVEISSDEEQWCPPNPDPPADPTEEELSGAAATLELFCSSATQRAGLRVSSKRQGGLKFHCEFFWVEFRVQHGSTWFNSEF